MRDAAKAMHPPMRTCCIAAVMLAAVFPVVPAAATSQLPIICQLDIFSGQRVSNQGIKSLYGHITMFTSWKEF